MNNVGLIFNPIFSPMIIIIVIAPAFIFLLFKEFQRKQKYLPLRLVALALLFFSLLGLLLKPSYQKKEKSGVIILTRGFDRTKADSLVKEHADLKIIRTQDSDGFTGASILSSWQEIVNENVAFVLGEGLPPFVLQSLKYKGFVFIPSQEPSGIVRLVLPETIFANQKNAVEGIFNGAGKANLKLIGPGGSEDSIVLKKGQNNFSLSFKTKQAGLFRYQLAIEDSISKQQEQLPIAVLPERKLRVLFIQKFPTAETRFLKNFLEEKGHAITLRYQTSKNNFVYEYANTPATRVDFLREEMLNSFDLIFADEKSLSTLSDVETTALEKSIHRGLGAIFIQANLKLKSFGRLISAKIDASTADTVHVKIDGSRNYISPIAPYQIPPQLTLKALLKNKKRILSGYFYLGLGKVGFQTLEETYRLSLHGEHDNYASIWSALIEAVARTENSGMKMRLKTSFPFYENEPIEFGLISSGRVPQVLADSVPLALAEDVVVDDYWLGKTWIGKQGWHKLSLKGESTQLNYFVSAANEWKSLRAANLVNQNLVVQNSNQHAISRRVISSFISGLWFYLIFLISGAFLWLAPKL